MLIHFYETTKFFANFFTKRHPLPPISLFHFMEWGIPPNPNCPFRTEENSTFPKPLSTYKGDVIDSEGRPSPSTFWYGSQAFALRVNLGCFICLRLIVRQPRNKISRRSAIPKHCEGLAASADPSFAPSLRGGAIGRGGAPLRVKGTGDYRKGHAGFPAKKNKGCHHPFLFISRNGKNQKILSILCHLALLGASGEHP